MNLLIITQKVDENDDLLGFFVDWIREFSKHFNKVFVITLAKGAHNLPANVEIHSLGKEKNSSKLYRLITFYKLLITLIPKSDGVFAHMSPIFVIASWPAAFLFRKRIIFWYLHRSVTFRLRLAEKLCYKIVTAAKESLKFKSNKIVEVGHGINIEKFMTKRSWDHKPRKIISVGRVSPIKNFETIIKALETLIDKDKNYSLKIIGQPIMPNDFKYLNQLKKLVRDLNLENFVQFKGFISHEKIVDYYKEADICVGALPSGGIDKAMLEGMASECIVMTSNDVFEKYFKDLWRYLGFRFNDSEDLAHKIMKLDDIELNNFGKSLFKIAQNHNMGQLISNIEKLFK